LEEPNLTDVVLDGLLELLVLLSHVPQLAHHVVQPLILLCNLALELLDVGVQFLEFDYVWYLCYLGRVGVFLRLRVGTSVLAGSSCGTSTALGGWPSRGCCPRAYGSRCWI
jgi:hypothetical protein